MNAEKSHVANVGRKHDACVPGRLLCCRTFEDRALFVRRCRDTFSDRRQLIVALDDEIVLSMLDRVRLGHRDEVVNHHLRELVREVGL